MKRILFVLVLCFLPISSMAAQQLITSGSGSAHQWSVQKDRLNANFNELYGWGNHANAGYLLTYTETDPIFTAWDKDYADLINKPTIPSAINDLSDVDTTGKATGRILEFNSSGNMVVGDKGSGTVTVVQTTDGGSTTSVPSQAAVGTSLETKVDLTNGGLLIDDLTKIKIKTTAEPVNGEPLVDATPSEKTKQTYTAAQTDTLVGAKADSSDLANQSAFESAFFTLPAGSFAFDTYPQYEDSAHSSGIAVNADTLAVYSSTSSKWLTVSLTDTLSPAPTTYSLTVDMIDGNGTDKFTYSSTDYTTDQTFSGLSADATFTVTADTGRTVSCTGTGLTDNTGGSYTANTDSENVTAACTYSASGGIACTGAETFIRGAGTSGDTESFEYGASDFCTTDIVISEATGVDTYSTGWYKFGTHSLALTDGSSTTDPVLRADHGSYQTDQYYRFYMKVPDVANYQFVSIAGIGKYPTSVQVNISIRDTSTGAGGEVLRLASESETIAITEGEEVRVELRVYDSDAGGAGYATLTLKAWDSAGDPIITSNGGTDYEITSTSTSDSFRYLYTMAKNSGATAVTVYSDGWKNCSTWCGGE